MSDFRYANVLAASLVSLLSNSTLIYLVQKYTKNTLKPYKRILGVQICLDISLSIVTALFHYTPASTSTVRFVVFGNISLGNYLPSNISIFFIFTQTFLLNSIVCILPFHYIYRYLHICHNKHMNCLQFFLLCFICLGVPLFCNISYVTFYWPKPELAEAHKLVLINITDGLREGGLMPIYFSARAEDSSKIALVPVISYIVVYCIIAFCIIAIMLHFKKLKTSMSAHTLQIQIQFDRMLFVGTSIPFITTVLPLFLNYIGVWLKTQIFSFSSSFTLSLGFWLAALNPLATIAIIGAYRQGFLRMIHCGIEKCLLTTTGHSHTTTVVKISSAAAS